MSWRNVRLVWLREVRDQLRDRRTLFVIAVLPLLLYPLLGMSMLQLNQFRQEHRDRVLVLGAEQLAAFESLPPLFEGDRFAEQLGDEPFLQQIDLEFPSLDPPPWLDPEPSPEGSQPGESAVARDALLADAEAKLRDGLVDAVIYFPPGFADRLVKYQQQLTAAREGDDKQAVLTPVDPPEVLYNSAQETSMLANIRLARLLDRWAVEVGRRNLRANRLPPEAAKPFGFGEQDVASGPRRQAALWSKILPLIVILWALTGAFYPAIDICAGEKERGTLETLLCSPALRTEIVWGKLLTVMCFSVSTALLNLLSVGLTAQFVITRLGALSSAAAAMPIASPPLSAMLWLVLALIPVSALFSALCLALAAFARSSKEGQYYLMPLVLLSMPLVIFPMTSRLELNLGTSLIPVTGLVLLLQNAIEGQIWEVVRFAIPVVLVTGICCWMAIRWAVEQFNRESVLFRESERFDLARWMVSVVRDRGETPTAMAAIFAALLIFVVQFFVKMGLMGHAPTDLAGVLQVLFISQVVCILVPALLLTLLLTRRPRKTLLLERFPSVSAVAVAILLALVLYPLGYEMSVAIKSIYPLPVEIQRAASEFLKPLGDTESMGLMILLLAALPAVCEEIAFRGLILSGLRKVGHKWWAIGISAVLFGMAHAVVQQQISAAVLGFVLGFIAVQTGNLIPCIAFHVVYNGMQLWAVDFGQQLQNSYAHSPLARLIVRRDARWEDLGPFYNWPLLVGCGLVALYLFAYLQRLPYERSREEELSDLREESSRDPLLSEA